MPAGRCARIRPSRCDERMKRQWIATKRSPKPEGRGPKEGRRSKSDDRRTAESRGPLPDREIPSQADATSPAGGGVDYQVSAEALVLRECGSTGGSAPEALNERTSRFGERIIEFATKVPQNPVNS